MLCLIYGLITALEAVKADQNQKYLASLHQVKFAFLILKYLIFLISVTAQK